MRKGQNQEEENYFNRVIEKEYETIYRACDKKTDLYILQQNMFSTSGQIPSEMISNCARYVDSGFRFRLAFIVHYHLRRPYNLNRIPYSNLLLVVVNVEISQCSHRVSATATEMHYATEEFPCYKLQLNDLPRRRLDECFTEHPDVR